MKTARLIANNLLVVALFALAVVAIQSWWGNPNTNSSLPSVIPQDRLIAKQDESIVTEKLELSIEKASIISSSAIPEGVSLSFAADQSSHSHYLLLTLSTTNLGEHEISLPYYGSDAKIQITLGLSHPFPQLINALHPKDAGKIANSPIFDNSPIQAGESKSGIIVFALASKRKDYHFLIVGNEWKDKNQTLSIPSIDISLTKLQNN